jgi:DNA-binding NtrC family response regulator
VAPRRCPVLIVGESGTGKGLMAPLVHRYSRRSGQFIRASAAQLHGGLAPADLRGHVRGGFTGAVKDRSGLAALADRGTLFVDELQVAPKPLQVQLLDIIEGEPLRPLGGDREFQPDLRIVAASQLPLAALVAAGRLREDLAWRLDVATITLPPLRERAEDVEPLARHFAGVLARLEQIAVPSFNKGALALMRRYSWPGNVRQLANAVYRAAIVATNGVIQPEHLQLRAVSGSDHPLPARLPPRPPHQTLAVMQDTEGNVSEAARRMGVTRKTVRNHLKRLGTNPEEVRFGKPRPKLPAQ